MKVTSAESVKTSVEQNIMPARAEKKVRALRTLANANVERNLTIVDAMSNIRKQLEGERSIDCSDHFVKILKLDG